MYKRKRCVSLYPGNQCEKWFPMVVCWCSCERLLIPCFGGLFEKSLDSSSKENIAKLKLEYQHCSTGQLQAIPWQQQRWAGPKHEMVWRALYAQRQGVTHHSSLTGCRYTQVQEIAPLYFPKVDREKILFISNRVPLENNTSTDWNVLLKGAQSRNVSTLARFIRG